jgi:Zn ribbon nucleic-acid-binding protein
MEKIVKGREWKTKKARYTFEEVKTLLKTEGYTLLEEEYSNSKTKMKVKCPKGHEREIRFDNWIAGHRCSSCRNQREITPKWKIAKKDMIKRGYTVKGEPEKSSAKVSLMCSKGHLFDVSIYNWMKGSRCPQCSRQERYMGFLNLSRSFRKK